MDLTISQSGLLLKANLEIHFRVEEIEKYPVLVTNGFLEFKLPLKEKVRFDFSGRDSFDSTLAIQLQKFRFEDGKKYFGEWIRSENSIVYSDQRKKFDFNFEKKIDQPLMSVGALLFCLTRMKQDRSQAIYIGARKLYAIEFVKETRDESTDHIQIFQSHIEESFEKKTLAASLFVDSKTKEFKGGEVYLPVIGKIRF